MDSWTVVRFLHVVAFSLFVGGQLLLTVAVVPQLRAQELAPLMRSIARRFGIATAAALAVAIATGVAMAGHFARWSDPTLQAKLAALVLVGVLLGLHIASPSSRAVSMGVLLASLLVLWLGVSLAHG
jgi:uncharacterized membrane protein